MFKLLFKCTHFAKSVSTHPKMCPCLTARTLLTTHPLSHNKIMFYNIFNILVGVPDVPADVQVEPGPQPGTLLVSWRPVSTQPRAPSRAAVHSYLVFADGRNIAQVPSATGLSLYSYSLYIIRLRYGTGSRRDFPGIPIPIP